MIRNKLFSVAAVIFLSSSVFATDWVVDGTISGSPHDLSGSVSGDNGEICVYCHTPHASNVGFSGAPLWNKEDINASSFTMYGAGSAGVAGSTIAGTATSATPESPSLACLSCHDGVSAVDSIVNAPGSGSGSLGTGTNAITVGITNANANIGTDLTNDHPVSIVYTEGVAGLKDKNSTLSNTWVGVTTISQLLRSDRVECGSCHDPHNGYAPDQNDTQVNFLRTTNASSQLCLGCHDK